MVNGYGRTYAEQGRIYLAQAYEELAREDLSQAAEKGWGAAALLVKAAAEERGLPYNTHGFLFRAASALAREAGDMTIGSAFTTASGLHVNYYEGGLDEEIVRTNLTQITELIEKIEGMLNGRNGGATT